MNKERLLQILSENDIDSDDIMFDAIDAMAAMQQAVNEAIDEFKLTFIQTPYRIDDEESVTKLAEKLKVK